MSKHEIRVLITILQMDLANLHNNATS